MFINHVRSACVLSCKNYVRLRINCVRNIYERLRTIFERNICERLRAKFSNAFLNFFQKCVRKIRVYVKFVARRVRKSVYVKARRVFQPSVYHVV